MKLTVGLFFGAIGVVRRREDPLGGLKLQIIDHRLAEIQVRRREDPLGGLKHLSNEWSDGEV